MTRSKKFLKLFRIVGYTFVSIVILFMVVWALLNDYFNKRLIEYAKVQVTESTHGDYALSLNGLAISLLSRTITFENVILEPVNRGGSSKAQYTFKAKSLKIVNFSILSYIRDRNLLIDKLEFESPQIAILQGVEKISNRKSASSLAEKFSLYAAFSKELNSISVDRIDIVNSQFNMYKNISDTSAFFSSNDNSISIKNFRINSETDNDNNYFIAEKFEIVMNKFSYRLGDGLYTLKGKGLHTSYTDASLIVDSLQLVPNFSKKEFADEAGRQISRIKINSSKINCKKIDVKLFFEYGWLVIHKVDIEGATIDVFRDNTLPLQQIVRPSLQAMIKNLPFYISIDSIEMKNGKVAFEVQNPGAISKGTMAVNKLGIIVTGVQNDTSLYIADQSIKVDVTGLVLNEGKFTETFVFPLKYTKEFFYCSGSITAMPMASFNSIIEQAKKISIKQGQLDHASFSFVANGGISKGTMKFLYHDLKIEPVNAENENDGLKGKVKTFLANKLIIIDSNPGKDGVVRVSDIYAEHNPYRFFLFYSMQSILSGITPAIKNEKSTKWIKKIK